MRYHINPIYKHLKKQILEIPGIFELQGKILQDGRNTIKILEIEGLKINVKSFKTPNIINKYAYRYLRESKAKRSFDYATRLLEMEISTPEPIACIEFYKNGGLSNSYYISIQEECDYTYRELIGKEIAEIEKVLIEFTRFTYDFHKKGMYFIDHSPGNTLIKEEGLNFKFYLVDLNRTKFKNVDLDLGIKNFFRIGANEEMIKIMANEYANLWNADANYVTKKMLNITLRHNDAVRKKKLARAKKQRQKTEV